MLVEPWRNEETFEKLERFFPEWEQGIKAELDRAEAELTGAKRDAEEKRRGLAALGTTVEANIAQAERQLTQAKRGAKKNPGAVSVFKEVLKRASRPKTDYAEAVKTVKRLEATIKRAKADTERCGKIINAYNKIKAI